MTQYRLIQEYPGHSLGEIHTADKGTKWYGTIFYNANPKFWQKVEEVEEADYEILEIKGVITGTIHKYDGVNNFETILRVSDCFTIHSVKRLSDGEVFTIGDETSHGTISSIEINISYDGGVLFRLKEKTIIICLATAKKLPKKTPLFTTEDGIDVFEGDILFYVLKSFQIHSNPANKLDGTNKDYKYFSTKENAEDYVIYNKPCLSVNEIIAVIPCFWFEKQILIAKSKSKL